MSQAQQQKTKCACNGMPQRGAMCGHVIVGANFCGYRGKEICQHMVKAEASRYSSDVESDGGEI